jgi:hypothetical protein
MGQLADVLIAEIVDTGLLGENIIAATSDARRLLCKADVIIIPDGAAAYAGSIKSEEITRERSVDAANGFDISLFNNLRPNMYLQTDLSKFQWQMLCDPTRVFEFDFFQDIPTAAEGSFRLPPHSDGIAHGMAFLFDFRLSPEVTLSTSPGAPRTHWHQAVYILPEPMEIKQNESVQPFASHNHSKISLSLKG